jgi:hydrogenase-4 component E
MAVECGLLVELGILLDVFALIFIMGIAVLKINRQFEHIDSDKLNLLADTNDSKGSK